MSIIQYMTVTTVMGAKLYEMVFLYAFLFAGGILCMGVIHHKRWMPVLGYLAAMTDILFFMVFFCLDMYSKVLEWAGSESIWIYGSGVLTGLVFLFCIAGIFVILMALRRLLSDKRYSF